MKWQLQPIFKWIEFSYCLSSCKCLFHLLSKSFQGVQEKANLTSPLLSKEDPIFGSLSYHLGRSMDEVGHRIYQGLLRVSKPKACVACRPWNVSRHLDIFLCCCCCCVLVTELFILGTVQYGILLLAHEEWATAGYWLCGPCPAFLTQVRTYTQAHASGCPTENHLGNVEVVLVGD